MVGCGSGTSGEAAPESAPATLAPWLTVTPGPGEAAVTLTYSGSACAELDRVYVVESPTAVSLFVYERLTDPTGTSDIQDCPAVEVTWRVRLDIRQPVAGRRIGGCTVPVPDACPEPDGETYEATVEDAVRADG
jgi:hypothetical protein